jgi:hypothetical protein
MKAIRLRSADQVELHGMDVEHGVCVGCNKAFPRYVDDKAAKLARCTYLRFESPGGLDQRLCVAVLNYQRRSSGRV